MEPTVAGGESADSISVITAKTILSPSQKTVEENNLDPKQITAPKKMAAVKGDVLAVLNSRADLKNVGEAKDEHLEQAVVKETKSASRAEEDKDEPLTRAVAGAGRTNRNAYYL